MAKKDKSSKKKAGESRPDPSEVIEAVRGAVERTFQATTGQTGDARDRGRGLLDDVASAAQRIRESFDDLRVLEDVRGLRAEIEALSRRVAELEKKQAAKPAGTARSTRSSGASRSSGTTARKAAAKPTAAGTAAKTTGPKPKPAARRKPASGGAN